MYNFKDKYRDPIHKKIMSLVNSEAVKSNCIKLAKKEFDIFNDKDLSERFIKKINYHFLHIFSFEPFIFRVK